MFVTNVDVFVETIVNEWGIGCGSFDAEIGDAEEVVGILDGFSEVITFESFDVIFTRSVCLGGGIEK